MTQKQDANRNCNSHKPIVTQRCPMLSQWRKQCLVQDVERFEVSDLQLGIPTRCAVGATGSCLPSASLRCQPASLDFAISAGSTCVIDEWDGWRASTSPPLGVSTLVGTATVLHHAQLQSTSPSLPLPLHPRILPHMQARASRIPARSIALQAARLYASSSSPIRSIPNFISSRSSVSVCSCCAPVGLPRP